MLPVSRFRVEDYAGYRSLEWSGIQPKLNLLVGQNGVGKSLLLEALVATLNYVAGKHLRDALSRFYSHSMFEIQFAGDSAVHRFSTTNIRSIQGARQTGHACRVLYTVENRQPKNVVGRKGPEHRDNPITRYNETIARMKHLITSKAVEEAALVEEVFDLCRRLPEVARPDEWKWIREEIVKRSPTQLRPLSCGQFDVLAAVLDVVTFRNDVMANKGINYYVVLDNPATYLHPACLEPLLKLYREQLPEAQFFVATHSPKLLAYAEPKSVFWIQRDARSQAEARINSIRTLTTGARSAFLELYGQDTSLAILGLLGELESPQVYYFLRQCIQECASRARPRPADDSQLALVKNVLPGSPSCILDFGAGHGDLLAALTHGDGDTKIAYFAYDPHPSELLAERLRIAMTNARLDPQSRIVVSLEDLPTRCEAAALVNVCHNLRIPTLAETLACLLEQYIVRRRGAGLVVSELRTLAEGEREFIVWTTKDFQSIFAGHKGLIVESKAHLGGHEFEAIDVTLIRWQNDEAHDVIGSAALEARLWSLLPMKRESALEELARLRANRHDSGIAERWRQHRVAFLCAQITWLCEAERMHQ